MLVSIGIYRNRLAIVQGTRSGKGIKVKSALDMPLQDNDCLNGALRDPMAVGAALKQVLLENKITAKEAVICLTSTSVMYRELTVPKGSKKQTQAFVKQELGQSFGNNAEILADYILLPAGTVSRSAEEENSKTAKRGQHVLAACVQKDMVDSYRKMLVSAGLKPVAMDICSGAIEKFAALYPEVSGGSDAAILCHANGETVTCTLLIGGVQIFTRPARLTQGNAAFGEESGTNGEEIARTASQMVQFYIARKLGAPLKGIWLCGDIPHETDELVRSVCAQPVFFFGQTERIKGAVVENSSRYACALGMLVRR